MDTSAAPAGREVRSLEDIAQAVVRAIKQHTTHVAWFDGSDPLTPRVTTGKDVTGDVETIRLVSALPGSRILSTTKGRLRVDDPSSWWDYELQVQHHTGALALPGKRWELSVRPPSLRYPGWNRRIVASGESWDSDESVGMAIEYASGPLDILVRDAKRRRGEDW